MGALSVRKHLDNARFSLSAAFMELFPNIFNPKAVLNMHDSTGKTVTWRFFKSTLEKYFKEYHEIQSTDQGRTWYLVQIHSCLEDLSGGKSTFYTSSGAPERESAADEALLGGFTNVWMDVPCDEEGVVDEEDDDFVKREMQFFLPTVIWEYNKCKKALVDIDRKIHEWKLIVRNSTEAMNGMLPHNGQIVLPPVDPPQTESRFLVGTALDVRAEMAWFQFLSNKMASQYAESTIEDTGASRRKREDPDEDRLVEYERKYKAVERFVKRMPDWDRKFSGRSSADTYRPGSRYPPSSAQAPGASSSRHRSGDQKREMVISVLQSQIKDANDHVSEFLETRRELLRRFNIFRKYLEIVLDPDIVRMAVLDDSVLRKVTNTYAHMNDHFDGAFPESLRGIQELFDAAGKKKVEDFQGLVNKLSRVLYEEEDYFDRGSLTVERNLDQYIGNSAPKGAKVTETLTEFHILFMRMEPLQPTNEH